MTRHRKIGEEQQQSDRQRIVIDMRIPKPMGRRVMLCLGAVALFVPLISLYVGFMLTDIMVPYRNIIPDPDVVVVDSAMLDISQYKTHNVTIHFTGGLGAQMFQYAAVYGIAKACGLNPLVTSDAARCELTHVFPFLQAATSATARPGNYFPKFREHKAQAFDLRSFSLNYLKDIELVGQFQSFRYFDHVRAEIRQQFSFSRSAVELVQNFLHKSTKEAADIVLNEGRFGEDSAHFPVTYIGVHVRRKGYDLESNRKLGYKAADENYFSAAMNYYKHKHKNVIFLVTTDDLEWCQGHLNVPSVVIMYSPFTHHGLDMCLLTQCNHTIITTGAFGWWGAWLSGGTVLYYKDHPVRKSELAQQFKGLDYFPEDWLPIVS